MYRTKRWFLGLENFLVKSLHIVQVQEDKDLDYISEEKENYTLSQRPNNFHKTTGKWVGIEVKSVHHSAIHFYEFKLRSSCQGYDAWFELYAI